MTSYLDQGATLVRGTEIIAAGGRVRFELQLDGNAVLSHDGHPVWSLWDSLPHLYPSQLTVDSTGLAALGADGSHLWSSPGGTSMWSKELRLTDDGQLVLSSRNALWATGTTQRNAPLALPPAVIGEGEALAPWDELRVGDMSAWVGKTGSLNVAMSGTVLWSSPPRPSAMNPYLSLDKPFGSERTAVVKESGGTPVWYPPIPSEWVGGRMELRLQSDGNLVLYHLVELWRATEVPILRSEGLGKLVERALDPDHPITMSDGSGAVSAIVPLNDADGAPVGDSGNLVLVVVEGRLSGDQGLQRKVRRYVDDLRADGYDARYLTISMYSGSLVQDGLLVCAIRRALVAVKAAAKGFSGVVLVGSFPEATIVRRWLWDSISPDPVVKPGVATGRHYVQCWPEPVANWSDIVLADLTGAWERLYRPRGSIQGFKGLVPEGFTYEHDTKVTFARGDYLHPQLEFADCFYIQDDALNLSIDPMTGSASITVDTLRRNPEVFEPTGTMPNAIARPDIFVSRVDARGAAYSVDPARRDSQGRAYVDANGVPQRVLDDIDPAPPTDVGTLVPDALLELRLLSDYFDRNHAHRTVRPTTAPDSIVSVSSKDFPLDAADHATAVRGAVGAVGEAKIMGGALVPDYVTSWTAPASLRLLHAHSSTVNSAFSDWGPPVTPGGPPVQLVGYTDPQLESLIPGPMYRWHLNPATAQYIPGAAGQGAWADIWLHRSMWLAGMSPASASFVVHYGCDTPNALDTGVAYSHPGYAPGRLASCLMFYTDALVFFGRTKVFNDAPTQFLEGLSDGHAGSAWKKLYEDAARNPALAEFTESVNSKICYSWVMLGDWTLRRRYP